MPLPIEWHDDPQTESSLSAMLVSMNIGPHEISIDGDLLTARWHGAPSRQELEEVLTRAEGVIRSHGLLLVLNDMRQAGPAGAEARRYMQQWISRNPSFILVTFGVTQTVRVVLYLMTRAMVLLGLRPPVNHFFATESEARAWIDEFRRSGQRLPAP